MKWDGFVEGRGLFDQLRAMKEDVRKETELVESDVLGKQKAGDDAQVDGGELKVSTGSEAGAGSSFQRLDCQIILDHIGARGPNYQSMGREELESSLDDFHGPCEQGTASQSILAYSSVLHLRGEKVQAQPIVSE